MKDILLGTDPNGQTVCVFRKGGVAIYGQWVGGAYQTVVIRNGDKLPALTPLPPLYGPRIKATLEEELDAELQSFPRGSTLPRPGSPPLSQANIDAAARRRREAVARRTCPLCREPWGRDGTHPRRLSRDHIRKRSDGHKSFVLGDTHNIRFVCQECNNLLNRLGQCAGAVACWIAVARRNLAA